MTLHNKENVVVALNYTLKMVKIIDFMLCIVYHNENPLKSSLPRVSQLVTSRTRI